MGAAGWRYTTAEHEVSEGKSSKSTRSHLFVGRDNVTTPEGSFPASQVQYCSLDSSLDSRQRAAAVLSDRSQLFVGICWLASLRRSMFCGLGHFAAG